jgi:hypothetical protein
MSNLLPHPQPLTTWFYVGKVFVLLFEFYSSIEKIIFTRSDAIRAFTAQYSVLTTWVSTFATIQFPELYNYSADLVLLWNYTKVLLILIQFWPNLGGMRAIKQIVIFETFWSILSGNTCLCYYVQQLTMIAGLIYLITMK